MLVSRVFLGINVFEINIEGEEEEQLASVSTIMTGNVATPYHVLSCPDILSCLLIQSPYLFTI